MKKKTIRRIVAGIFTAVMVIAALPQAGVSAYAKTSLPVKNHEFYTGWAASTFRDYNFKITGNKFYYNDSGSDYGPEFKKAGVSWDETFGYRGISETRSCGTIYDVRKVSNKKYTFRIKNDYRKNKHRKVYGGGTITRYTNSFKDGTKMTLYLPGYRVSQLPKDHGDNQTLDGFGDIPKNTKLKGYALYVTYRKGGSFNPNVKHSLLLDSKADDGILTSIIRWS